jgi:hypothetical protein
MEFVRSQRYPCSASGPFEYQEPPASHPARYLLQHFTVVPHVLTLASLHNLVSRQPGDLVGDLRLTRDMGPPRMSLASFPHRHHVCGLPHARSLACRGIINAGNLEGGRCQAALCGMVRPLTGAGRYCRWKHRSSPVSSMTSTLSQPRPLGLVAGQREIRPHQS